MGELVELDAHRPHEVAYVLCPSCAKKHVSVHPVGCTRVECTCGFWVPLEPANLLPLEAERVTLRLVSETPSLEVFVDNIQLPPETTFVDAGAVSYGSISDVEDS